MRGRRWEKCLEIFGVWMSDYYLKLAIWQTLTKYLIMNKPCKIIVHSNVSFLVYTGSELH